MPLDVNKTITILEILKSFNTKQWAVMIFVVVLSVMSAFWVEKRYAKISEIDKKFQQNQQQLDFAYFLSLELFGSLPESERNRISQKLELSKKNKEAK